jgi:hypothetical protein
MDGQDLLERLRDDHETALSRLGSSKALYAATDGEMTAAAVRVAAADECHLAARTFDAWAADEDDERATEAFAAATERAREGYDLIAPDDHAPADSLPTYAHLDGVEGTAGRAGGLLARALIAGRRFEQVVGFFVGDADPATAETARRLRDGANEEREAAVALLAAVAATDDDRERARTVAGETIGVAYDDYVERLEAMGIEPKNVC